MNDVLCRAIPLQILKTASEHLYEVQPRQDRRVVDLISDALPFGRLWYDTPDNAIGYAMAQQPFT